MAHYDAELKVDGFIPLFTGNSHCFQSKKPTIKFSDEERKLLETNLIEVF